MKIDQYISSAKSQFQIFLLTLAISVYLFFTYYSDYRKLNVARDDIACWLYYQRCKKDYFDFKTIQNNYENYYQYCPSLKKDCDCYDSYFGKVLFPSDSIYVNVPVPVDQESYYGPYKKLKYWKRKFKHDPLLIDKNFNSQQRIKLKIALDAFYAKPHSLDSLKETDPLDSTLNFKQDSIEKHLKAVL